MRARKLKESWRAFSYEQQRERITSISLDVVMFMLIEMLMHFSVPVLIADTGAMHAYTFPGPFEASLYSCKLQVPEVERASYRIRPERRDIIFFGERRLHLTGPAETEVLTPYLLTSI
mmetsp:Transcript_32677/g.79301  ORF Transcript_32677/g.79301 Transcript_32677/m.79301 type:complete len:118 (+) Transcript_32677:284-637(+)